MEVEYAEILRTFLEDILFQFLPGDYHLAVEDQLKRYFKEAGFSESFIQDLQPIIQSSAGIAMTAYQSTPFEIQCIIGIYAIYTIAIDDRARDMKQDLKDFNACLLSGKPQGNKLLQSFAHFLASMRPTFGQFGSDMIIKGSLEFISSCYLETEAKSRLCFPTTSPDFAYYLRLKTGVAEPYAFMMFPEQQFPEDECLGIYLPTVWYLQRYINSTNDIMSFYKEMLELEDWNFIHNSAKSYGVTPLELFRRLCKETAEHVRSLRSMSATHSELSVTIERFIQGYIVYHLSQPRYRLAELDLPMVAEAEHRVNIARGAE